MSSRDQIHDLILTRLWGPCEVISDETEAKVFEAADAILALSEGKSATEGEWVRVPKEPTDAILRAFDAYRHNASSAVAWAALLYAASPTGEDR